MKDQKATCLNSLTQLIVEIIDNNCKRNYYKFVRINENFEIFKKHYSKLLKEKNINESTISLSDYEVILSNLEKKYIDEKKDGVRIRNIISNEVSFIPIQDINTNTLNSSNKKIYDEAIQIINHHYSDNNVFIGTKNDDLVRMLKDKNGNVKSWAVQKKGRIVSNSNDSVKSKTLSVSDNKGLSFSNILIFSFIIGSFLGILFLSLYVKFMK